MRADLPWSEITLTFSPEDCGAMAKKIREDQNLSVERLSSTTNLTVRYINECEKGSLKSFAYLYKLVTRYDELSAETIIRNGNR
jgi:transcriptional regulator with XRE-family HTH domain